MKAFCIGKRDMGICVQTIKNEVDEFRGEKTAFGFVNSRRLFFGDVNAVRINSVIEKANRIVAQCVDMCFKMIQHGEPFRTKL